MIASVNGWRPFAWSVLTVRMVMDKALLAFCPVLFGSAVYTFSLIAWVGITDCWADWSLCPAAHSVLKVVISTLNSCIYFCISWTKPNGSGCFAILVVATGFLLLSSTLHWTPMLSRVKDQSAWLTLCHDRLCFPKNFLQIDWYAGGCPVKDTPTLKLDMFLNKVSKNSIMKKVSY